MFKVFDGKKGLTNEGKSFLDEFSFLEGLRPIMECLNRDVIAKIHKDCFEKSKVVKAIKMTQRVIPSRWMVWDTGRIVSNAETDSLLADWKMPPTVRTLLLRTSVNGRFAVLVEKPDLDCYILHLVKSFTRSELGGWSYDTEESLGYLLINDYIDQQDYDRRIKYIDSLEDELDEMDDCEE